MTPDRSFATRFFLFVAFRYALCRAEITLVDLVKDQAFRTVSSNQGFLAGDHTQKLRFRMQYYSNLVVPSC